MDFVRPALEIEQVQQRPACFGNKRIKFDRFFPAFLGQNIVVLQVVGLAFGEPYHGGLLGGVGLHLLQVIQGTLWFGNLPVQSELRHEQVGAVVVGKRPKIARREVLGPIKVTLSSQGTNLAQAGRGPGPRDSVTAPTPKRASMPARMNQVGPPRRALIVMLSQGSRTVARSEFYHDKRADLPTVCWFSFARSLAGLSTAQVGYHLTALADSPEKRDLRRIPTFVTEAFMKPMSLMSAPRFPQAVASNRRKPLVIIIVAVLVTLASAAAVWLYIGMQDRRQARAARQALHQGQLDEASRLLDRWLGNRPQAAEAHYLKARLAWAETIFPPYIGNWPGLERSVTLRNRWPSGAACSWPKPIRKRRLSLC